MFASLRVLVFCGVSLGALVFMPFRAGAESSSRMVIHEEFGHVIEELTRHFKGLGARLRGYIGADDSVYERPLITFMLRHEAELQLTDPQVKYLERLRSEFERSAIRQRAELRVAELELRDLLDAERLDMEKVEVKIRQIEKLGADLRLWRIRTIENGKARLTSEQQEVLRGLLDAERWFSSMIGRASQSYRSFQANNDTFLCRRSDHRTQLETSRSFRLA